MVAVGAAKTMKTLASNGLFTDFPIVIEAGRGERFLANAKSF
jgi:hypothetical protein